MVFDYCPQCKLEIPAERNSGVIKVCPHCGWSHSPNKSVIQDDVSKRFIKISIATSFIFVVAFMHAVTWDKFFFEVIPLKAKHVIGFASGSDYGRLAEMCKVRKDSQCVEDMLIKKVQADPQDLESLVELGQIQFQRRNFKASATTFNKYFTSGGLNLEASYTYARALGQVGQVDESSTQYQKVLDAKPETLQVTVTQNYVRMLIQNGRNDQAKVVIESIRSKGTNAAMFMESEMQQITGGGSTNNSPVTR